MNVLILGNMGDNQTGIYILTSFKGLVKNAAGIDTRRIIKEVKPEEAQGTILDEIKNVGFKPDLIIVMKGLEMTPNTLVKIKEMLPEAKMVNWFFDKFLVDKPIYFTTEFFEVIKLYDIFFCSLKGVTDKLTEAGLTNVKWLPEACHPEYHSAPFFNWYQEHKYGEDVTFIGSVGFLKQHNNRIRILSRIIKEGFRIKIWGEMVGDEKMIPKEIKEAWTGGPIINEQHSIACATSKINLGIDQDTFLELGQSARMYRVMCAGGLYLTTYVPKLETMFKINGDGKQITGEEDLVVYYSDEDLINKLDFLLENEDVRKKIALNGKKAVEQHTFKNRLIEVIKYAGTS